MKIKIAKRVCVALLVAACMVLAGCSMKKSNYSKLSMTSDQATVYKTVTAVNSDKAGAEGQQDAPDAEPVGDAAGGGADGQSADEYDHDDLPILSSEEIYKKISPSVVEVTSKGLVITDTFDMYAGATGTGFFIDEDGTVVTNYHVIENANTATITTSDGVIYNVDGVYAYDKTEDVAILKTSCKNSVPVIVRKSKVESGEKVYAIGSSLGLTGSFSEGMISNPDRYIDEIKYIQFSAPISHGNSGGPLIDSRGRIVGITSAYIEGGQNINLAKEIAIAVNLPRGKAQELSELFKAKQLIIGDFDFLYSSDNQKYALLFRMYDGHLMHLEGEGSADIKITNKNGEVVFEGTKDFGAANYGTWQFGLKVKTSMTAIYILPEEITPGSTPYGTVQVQVYGEDYTYSIVEFDTYELPTL